jgi:hypothetical protein
MRHLFFTPCTFGILEAFLTSNLQELLRDGLAGKLSASTESFMRNGCSMIRFQPPVRAVSKPRQIPAAEPPQAALAKPGDKAPLVGPAIAPSESIPAVAGSSPQGAAAKKAGKPGPLPKKNALASMWGKTAKHDAAEVRATEVDMAKATADDVLTDEVPELAVASPGIAVKRSKRAVRFLVRSPSRLQMLVFFLV